MCPLARVACILCRKQHSTASGHQIVYIDARVRIATPDVCQPSTVRRESADKLLPNVCGQPFGFCAFAVHGEVARILGDLCVGFVRTPMSARPSSGFRIVGRRNPRSARHAALGARRRRDSRLDCFVAIKGLPSAFASDTDRLARFDREAEAVPALSHSILSVWAISG